jgi:site-specific DNA-methyltransferase (adenine-specific)
MQVNGVSVPKFYDDGQITLFCGDCREFPQWTDADVLVTDPPYGMSYESSMNRGARRGVVKEKRPIAHDGTTAARDEALAMWGTRPALVFGTWRVERPRLTRHRLIWDKALGAGMGDLSMPWGHGEEEIYVLGNGFTGPRESNVIRAQGYAAPDANRPKHPTPKPVALMEALIEKCPPGVIADPFAGSGSTLIAARNLGRQAIGVELDEKYCELIVSRLAQQAFQFS